MIAFCFYVTGRDTRQRGKRGCTTEIAGVGGRQVGFVLDGEFTRSVSVLPITPIRHWQREHRLTLPRSTVQYVWDANPASCSIARRRLTADARGRISRDLVIRGLYFTFTILAVELPSSDTYRFYPASPRKLFAIIRRDNQFNQTGRFTADLGQLEFCDQSKSDFLDLANEICHWLEQLQVLIWWIIVC